MDTCTDKMIVTSALLVPKRRMKDVELVMKGTHPKYACLLQLIDKVNSDNRYKYKFQFI